MHLLGTVLQGFCDKLERTDHGLQFTVTAEEQFKTFITVSPQGFDTNIGRTHILNTDVGAAAVTTVATLDPAAYSPSRKRYLHSEPVQNPL